MGLTLIFVTFFVTRKLKKALQISVTPFSAESEVSSENATEWLVLAIFRIEVTTDLLSV